MELCTRTFQIAINKMSAWK